MVNGSSLSSQLTHSTFITCCSSGPRCGRLNPSLMLPPAHLVRGFAQDRPTGPAAAPLTPPPPTRSRSRRGTVGQHQTRAAHPNNLTPITPTCCTLGTPQQTTPTPHRSLRRGSRVHRVE